MIKNWDRRDLPVACTRGLTWRLIGASCFKFKRGGELRSKKPSRSQILRGSLKSAGSWHSTLFQPPRRLTSFSFSSEFLSDFISSQVAQPVKWLHKSILLLANGSSVLWWFQEISGMCSRRSSLEELQDIS